MVDFNRGTDGYSIVYAYDGNGNLVRELSLKRDQDHDGLPDIWEWLNGLSCSNATEHGSAWGDADGDGWSNYQEWKASTQPNNATSVPDIRGVAGTVACTLDAGFTPSNFVMGVGQLDGVEGEDLVIAADGDPGVKTNAIWILTQSSSIWTTQRVEIGTVGITSIGIGQPRNTEKPAIYLGTRQVIGQGSIIRISSTAQGWQKATLGVSTGDAAYVLGVRAGLDVLTSLAPAADGGLGALSYSNGAWSMSVIDPDVSHRGLGTLAFAGTNDAVGGGLRLLDAGGIRYASPSSMTCTQLNLSEPAATNRLLWRGPCVGGGQVRGRRDNSFSVFYAFIEDRNGNRICDADDRFTLAENWIVETNVQSFCTSSVALNVSAPTPSYGLASLNYTNGWADVLFTAEPDGRLFSWAPQNGTGTLQRQLFSAHRQGRSWHALGKARPLAPRGDTLAGICVDPAYPTKCTLVCWEPAWELWRSETIPQTAPQTRIMVTTNQGAGVTRVEVKIWDGEGNPSLPMLQYSINGTVWRQGTIWMLDGEAYAYTRTVQALPGGSLHGMIWRSGVDLGTNFNGTVYLRARSQDFASMGEWSATVALQMTASDDSDSDKLPDAWEMEHPWPCQPTATSRPSSTRTLSSTSSPQVGLTW